VKQAQRRRAPPAVARDLYRFSLGLVLKLAEFALKFQGARLCHDGLFYAGG
jgi:hypothetical protein